MKYPKILIIGNHYFDLHSGGGITLTNLFKGWDEECIAVAGENIYDPDYTVCKKFYQLGSAEIKRRFPFNLITRKKNIRSGLVNKNSPIVSKSLVGTNNSFFKNKYEKILSDTGLYHYKQRYQISEEFLDWVTQYSPDIIYSMLGSLELIEFIRELRKVLKKPIAIHIMDDWPVTITLAAKRPFRLFWQKIIDNELRHLLSEAQILFCISESMSNEYKIRYKKDFIPFHNPINLEFWNSAFRKNYEVNSPFIILYAGRIGPGVQNCFVDIAKAVNELTHNGFKIQLHIQATNFNPVLNYLLEFDFIKVKEITPYNSLPKIFSEVDLLLLPNDFENHSIAFLKHSMPTKASEYMISGSPILVYSSIETAVTRHALKYGWGYVVSENDNSKLKSAITEIYEKKDLRSKLGNTAREYAIKNYDDVIVRENFRNSFII
jgi:glycosyltransferase involved in cell wall biosynthesis